MFEQWTLRLLRRYLGVGNASIVIEFTALNQRDPIRCCAARPNAESEMPT
jgi:hypothetical protein